LTVAGASGSALCLAAGGEVQVNSGAQTCTVSSARFKHDIESQVSGLDTIRGLRPVSFKYNNDPSEQVRLGLIAEEVKEVDPRLVFKGDDNLPRGVRYEDLTSVLTKAVQELDLKLTQYNATSTASTTADLLTENSTFMSKVFNKLKEYISTVSDWVVNKITAVTGVFNRLETNVANVKSGIEMQDQSTGDMYCVQIKNGEFVKEKGSCSNPNISTSTQTESIKTTQNGDNLASTTQDVPNNNENDKISTSTAPSDSSADNATSSVAQNSVSPTTNATGTGGDNLESTQNNNASKNEVIDQSQNSNTSNVTNATLTSTNENATTVEASIKTDSAPAPISVPEVSSSPINSQATSGSVDVSSQISN
jgi:hypothetical protein